MKLIYCKRSLWDISRMMNNSNPFAQWFKDWFDMWNIRFPDYSRSITVEPIFNERAQSVKEDLCGVIIPFRDPFETIFSQTIKPSLKNLGFTVRKADSIFFREKESPPLRTGVYSSSASTSGSSRPGPRPRARLVSVMERIWILISEAQLLVADVTDTNPNVFYELGIAHTIGKDVIIISQREKDIPFDIRHLPFIIYNDDEEGQKKLGSDIEIAVKTAKPK